VHVPEFSETKLIRPLRVLYRDPELVVVDKPAGLPVHRGFSKARDVAMMRVRDALGTHVYPVHRLDSGTSGVLVFALSSEVAALMGRAFEQQAVKKLYVGLVRGVPPSKLVIDHPVPSREERSSPRVPARTSIELAERFGRYSLILARPSTGRLHQIRRHLKHISCPLLGDVRYGKGEHNRLFRERFGLYRLFLHARAIEFPHPTTGVSLGIDAPLPAELERVLTQLRTIERDGG